MSMTREELTRPSQSLIQQAQDWVKDHWELPWDDYRVACFAQHIADQQTKELRERSQDQLLCPAHLSLDKRDQLKPLDNCIACIRNQRDELERELRAARERIAELEQVLVDAFDDTAWLERKRWGKSKDEIQGKLRGMLARLGAAISRTLRAQPKQETKP